MPNLLLIIWNQPTVGIINTFANVKICYLGFGKSAMLHSRNNQLTILLKLYKDNFILKSLINLL